MLLYDSTTTEATGDAAATTATTPTTPPTPTTLTPAITIITSTAYYIIVTTYHAHPATATVFKAGVCQVGLTRQ